MNPTEPIIVCPKCGTEIKLNESLAAPLLEATRREYEERLAKKDAESAAREKSLREREAELARGREKIEERVAERLEEEKRRIVAEEARKARAALGVDLEEKSREIGELHEVLKQREEKLAAAQKAQADLLRKERELDDARREIDLTVEKRVQAGLLATRDQARREAEEGLKLKVAEKEQTIASMQRQIEDLKRRAEQGSQQLQGEVQELEIEAILRAKFPLDIVDPVPKGAPGGDALQRVVGPSGQPCGTILWESKRTKNWCEGWLGKLRDDQRDARAEIAVLVSQALPKGVETFDLVEGIWVTHPRSALPVALALRQNLIDLAAARQAADGQQGKMELVYQYLTGPRFRQRIQGIVESFSSMREDLDRERKVITKQWAKREEQIERVMGGTVGLYGDLQGIAGRTLPEVEGLELKSLEAGEPPAPKAEGPSGDRPSSIRSEEMMDRG